MIWDTIYLKWRRFNAAVIFQPFAPYTKWRTFCRRHFQLHFLRLELSYFYWSSYEIYFYGSRWQVCIEAKPLFGTLQTRFNETYVCHNGTVNATIRDLLRQTDNAPVPYPTIHYFVKESWTCVHISVTKWYIVGYLYDALWDM